MANASSKFILALFATILLLHYIQGGKGQLKRYANFVFTGRTQSSPPRGGLLTPKISKAEQQEAMKQRQESQKSSRKGLY